MSYQRSTTMSHSAAAAPEGTTDLIERIRDGLGPTLSRRIGPQHATVLATMLEMGEATPPEARTLYKALLDSGRGMVMARLYRVLRVLEEAEVIRRDWVANGGRVRGIYRVRDDLKATQCETPACGGRGGADPMHASDFPPRIPGRGTLITFTGGR